MLAKCLDKQTPQENLVMAQRYTRNFIRRRAPLSSQPQPIGFIQKQTTIEEKNRQEDYVRNTLGWTSCLKKEITAKREKHDQRRLITTATVRVNNNVL